MEIITAQIVTTTDTIIIQNVAIFLDLVPSAQGVLLFLIAVPTKSMLKSIYKRYLTQFIFIISISSLLYLIYKL